jgi:hypothetical protein
MNLVNNHDKQASSTHKEKVKHSKCVQMIHVLHYKLYINTIGWNITLHFSFISPFIASFTTSFTFKNRPFHRKMPLPFTMVIIFYNLYSPMKGGEGWILHPEKPMNRTVPVQVKRKKKKQT